MLMKINRNNLNLLLARLLLRIGVEELLVIRDRNLRKSFLLISV